MEAVNSLQESASGYYPAPDESSPHSQPYYFKMYLTSSIYIDCIQYILVMWTCYILNKHNSLLEF
jgi:hypothetical protein